MTLEDLKRQCTLRYQNDYSDLGIWFESRATFTSSPIKTVKHVELNFFVSRIPNFSLLWSVKMTLTLFLVIVGFCCSDHNSLLNNEQEYKVYLPAGE